MRSKLWHLMIIFLLLSACGQGNGTSKDIGLPRILAVESFLADITRNITGDRLIVDSLIPVGVDPHAYQPTPQDAAKVADANVLIINGINLESFLQPLLESAGNSRQQVITASYGLTPAKVTSGTQVEEDPHFWLDPTKVITYVENIRDGLSKADPAGAPLYASNADKYIAQLKDLDTWISGQVNTISPARRLLVTNHETFGYFAARYGFKIVGSIMPSVSSGASPSAQELAALIDQVQLTGTPAIFLDTGSNPQIADQIASETGVKVVTDLYTHSLSAAGGPAATYIDMMKFDVGSIVSALK